MSRGIKIYTVPTDFTTLELVTSTGNPQYRDIVIVKPQNYNNKVAIYQYTYNINNVLIPTYIKDQYCTFTDNTIIPNVTVSRKAHHDDYRSLINALFVLMADKYGDTYYGTHNFENAKIKWHTIASKYALYLDGTTNALNLDYSYEFNINTINSDYSTINNIARFTLDGLYINTPTNISNTLTITSPSASGQTVITNSTINTEQLTTNDAYINNIDVGMSLTDNLVENFNADLLDGAHLQDIIDYINNLKVPVGTIIYSARSIPPDGYLKADGRAISRSEYSALFLAIGTTFGDGIVGDGGETFNLPDLRGEFVRGWADGRTDLDSGRIFGTYQDDAIKSHSHTYRQQMSMTKDWGYWTIHCGGPGGQTWTQSSDATGGIETRPRNIALLACIKY